MALDKTRASLQAAFQAILRKVKEVKYNEAMKERNDLQRKSLELLTNVPPGTRSEEDVEHLSSWLTKMKVRGEVGQEDEREGGKARWDQNLFKIPWGGECKAKLLLCVDKQGSKQ